MIKNCEKCGNEFDSFSKWGEKRFCSKKCSHSRTFCEEAKRKKSEALKGRKVGPKCGLSKEQYEEKLKKYKNSRARTQKSIPFEKLGTDGKRKRVFEEQNFSCAKCHLSTWLDHPITLELEHRDGNRSNNNRENLEGLCPNCHSLTKTWRGRNTKIKKISNEELLTCLLKSKNIKQALISLGMAPKGGNYLRAHRLLEKYNNL